MKVALKSLPGNYILPITLPLASDDHLFPFILEIFFFLALRMMTGCLIET